MSARATVVVVGGGIVGSCAALFLRAGEDAPEVIVLERDPTYARASTALSASAIRMQFSGALNVRMSMFGWSFIEARAEEVGLVRSAYLIVAGPAGEAVLRRNRAVQTAEGAEVAWLDPPALRARFPWLNTEDLAAGTLGLSREGWFDAYALLRRVRAEASALGARYVTDAAVAMEVEGGAVRAVRTAGGARIAADWVVNAAGPAAGDVAAMAGAVLPVEPRKRTVFVLRCPLQAPDMPLVFDTSGAWIRPESGNYIAGIAPPEEADPRADGDFEPDMALLEDLLWPALAHRIPAFEQLRVQRAWAGHYEVCTLDHNAVIGPYPEIPNLLFANGFSGHGVQHGPATGRGIAELVRQGRYVSLDLSELGYARVREGRAVRELNVY